MRTLYIILSVLILSTFVASAQRWEKVQIPAPYDKAYYLDIIFLPGDSQKGWACDNDSGYVVRTLDGGKTWAGSRVVPAGRVCHLEYIQFFPNDVGYTCGPGGIFKSVDGGVTWTEIAIPAQVGMVWGGWFKNSNEGWFTGGGCGYGAFLKTTDGANSFTVYLDTNDKISNLSDPLWQAGMAAGEVLAIGNGTLWESFDDGDSWQIRSRTGVQAPWHEEISRSGQTIMVSNARSNCPNGTYNGGGVRTSRDNGNTWTQFEIGASMFGVFLVDDEEAWASGWGGNVWQTTNGGVNWALKNCGIGTANMDDVFFIDRDNGWLAGEGIYRLAGAKREVTRDSLYFETVCADSASFDTLYVINSNLASSLWKYSIIADPDTNFTVDNVQPTDLPACDSIPIVVRYIGKTLGQHEAGLEIQFFDPDTTVIVHLIGRRGGLDAAPSGDYFEYYLRLGETLDKIIFWQSSSAPLESITEIVLDSGSTDIKLWASLPMEVPAKPQVVQMLVTATPRDTGWSAARFRVRLEPCGRDTFITIRVYGLSPIFESTPIVNLNIGCSVDSVFRVPITNSGNDVLSISEIRLEGPNATAYSIEGFVSGLVGPDWRIAQGAADTLVMRYRPQTGNDVASLVIEHDDKTLVRGLKTPWSVALNGQSDKPYFSVSPMVIDLGSMCLGTVRDTAFYVTNEGKKTISSLASPSSDRFEGFSASYSNIGIGVNKTFRFQWTPTTIGSFEDTVVVAVLPCDTSAVVIVRGDVIESWLEITPNPVTAVTSVGVPIRRTVTVTAHSPQPIRVTAITLVPNTNNVQRFLPGLPTTLNDGEQLTFDVEWTSAVPTTISELIVVEGDGICNVQARADLSINAQSDEVDVSKDNIFAVVKCDLGVAYDTVLVTSKASRAITMRIPDIVGSAAFAAVSPTAPTVLQPGESAEVIVSYNPSVDPSAAARLLLSFAPSGEELYVELLGEFHSSIISYTPSSFDFGTHGVCEDTVMRVVNVVNSGMLDDRLTVDVSGLPAGVSVAPGAVNLPAGGTAAFYVVYDPSSAIEGPFSGGFTISTQACDAVVPIRISGVTVGGSLLMSPNPVQVPRQDLGNFQVEIVTIENRSAEDRQVVQLVIDPASNEWRLLDNVDGLNIPAGTNTTVRVEYRPTVVGTSSATLQLTDVGSCETSSSIQLLGSARVKPDYVLQIGIDRHSAQPFTRVGIPVLWESDIRDARPSRVTFAVEYSKVLLSVDSTYSTYTDARVSATIIDGRVEVTADSLDVDFGEEGEIIALFGWANPAIPDTSTLDVIAGVVTAAEAVVIVDRDGLLKVENCGPYNAIALGGPTRVIVAPPQPASEAINLAVHAAYDEILDIELYDMAGNLLATSRGHLVPRGQSQLRVDIQDMTSGQYMVRVLTNHGGLFTLRCLVVR